MRRILVPLTAPSTAPPPVPFIGAAIHSLQGLTMGTTWSVKLVAVDDRCITALQNGIQQQLDEVVAQMSTWEPDSHLSRYNQAAAGTWQTLPKEFLYVLRYALDVAQASAGAYDPTAGPLVNTWGFGPDAKLAHRPEASVLAAARARVGWQRVQVDVEQQRVFQPGGVYLDFSAIAKGFAVDQVSRYLLRQGIEHHLVEVGGELRGVGIKPDFMPWWVALEQPLLLNNAEVQGDALDECVIALHHWSVATSGDYRRYFDLNDVRYSHTIDPRSGEPIQHGLASVTVIHPDCIAADAISTALNVMGLEQGMAFATERAIPARFVLRDANNFIEHLTPAFQALLQ